jgi:transcriptional regulator with XRE-family HTH domain
VRVRELREAKGWTRVELGRRARIHPADVSKIENGRIVPYGPQVRRLARALKVAESELLTKRD